MSISESNKFWQIIDQRFVPNGLLGNPILRRKARIMACAHLFVIITVCLISILSITLTPENNVSEWKSLAMFVVLSIIFKKWANFNLSGNLLAVAVAYILVPMVFESGGLYSDNLLWLLLCPMVATFFCYNHSEIGWYLALIAFSFYLYYTLDPSQTVSYSPSKNFSPLYLLISYTTLFTMVTGIVLLFKVGNQEIINTLQTNQEILELHQKKLEQKNQILRELSEKLARSNRDLESFAYASSHDLKEPLRMIGLYTQLIQKRLKGNLDGDTLEFMGYVTTGVGRMQRLLDDLLEYSRVGRGEDKIKSIDLNDVMFYVRTNLKIAIAESEATIEIPENMPQVFARYSEMVQLFQNLISNAIKFRSPDSPLVIKISFGQNEQFHTFRVCDNGIGIPQEFHTKIFNIFERIHSKSDYEGSGIGLATCKKIIQALGGTIAIDPSVVCGACFVFTIPREYAPKPVISEEIQQHLTHDQN